MSKLIEARLLKPGDRIRRGAHFHPVISVRQTTHPMARFPVVEVTHDRGVVNFTLNAKVEVEA